MRSILAAVAGIAIIIGSGSALAWDLHDSLAPGPTPQSADSAPSTSSRGADLRLPNVNVNWPNFVPQNGPPLSNSRCREAMIQSGERSSEAWTQCGRRVF
jgi:hypothetical protein